MNAANLDEHVVHEVGGPTIGGGPAAAVIALGVIALLPAGILPILLGAMANEGRLSEPGIGLTAALEALIMAAATGLFGAFAKPARLKLIGLAASLLLAAADIGTLASHGSGLMLLRAFAGIPEGVLLWITIAMIARTVTPERWSAVLLTSITVAQLPLSAVLTAWVVPKFGANGGYAVIAAASLSAAAISLFIPNRYAALPNQDGETGPPPPRGWLALLATLVFGAAFPAVAVYIVPLAQQAGLDPTIGGTAVTLSLGAQVVGGAVAAMVAGRIRYFPVFVGATLVWWLCFFAYGLSTPAWVFLAVTGVAGVVLLFASPFYVPMAIEVDPSRRTAVQSGAAQLLSGALGPLLASLVVRDHDVHGALWLGAGLLAAGLGLAGLLHFTARPAKAATA